MGHRDGASSKPGGTKPTSEKSPSGAPKKSNATASPPALSPSLTGHREHPLRMPCTEIGQPCRDITGRLLHPTLNEQSAGQVTATSVPRGWGSGDSLGTRVGEPGEPGGCRAGAYLSARLQKSRMAGMAARPAFGQGAGGDVGAPGQAEPPVPVSVGSRRQAGSNVMTTQQ